MQAPRNLVELIQRVRPKSALFTTFTFSVSHFDAVLLPVLRSVGCEEIAVLVDADEAADSVAASTSRAAGRAYRVAPVVAPGGGVFHPKLAYLVAAETDVLAVGSGNLTPSGLSMQLECFDVVSADDAPTVFLELAEWMGSLALQTAATSIQASQLLVQASQRSRGAYQRGDVTAAQNGLPPPNLIHSLAGTARNRIESVFFAEADHATLLTVLSPFHAPDGGSILRLASSLRAKALSVGMDGSRQVLTAPFDERRFKPALPTRFVLPDAKDGQKRLHAKVFEIQAVDKVLMVTGSVNATAQAFESTRNVEVSLARWLRKSPYEWRPASPEAYQSTLAETDFHPPRAMYVDAWLAPDRILCGTIVSRAPSAGIFELRVISGDTVVFETTVFIQDDGHFNVEAIPSFDLSKGAHLTVRKEGVSASCWLNLVEELELTVNERESRAAIARVLQGKFASEDIIEILNLVNLAASNLSPAVDLELPASADATKPLPDAEFSFMRWEKSGRKRNVMTFLANRPYDLLRALNAWMNRNVTANSEVRAKAPEGVQLLAEQGHGKDGTDSVDPYDLLDRVCQVIPAALERNPGSEQAGVLAEIVASRTIVRAILLRLGSAPYISWLDRYSRFTYPTQDLENLGAIAAAMSCLAAHELGDAREDAQLALFRESVERVSGMKLSEERFGELARKGFNSEIFRCVPPSDCNAAMAMGPIIAASETVDQGVLRNLPAILHKRRNASKDLLKGVMSESALAHGGCPFCYEALALHELVQLRQKHMIVHKSPTCNHLLFFSENSEQLAAGIREIIHA